MDDVAKRLLAAADRMSGGDLARSRTAAMMREAAEELVRLWAIENAIPHRQAGFEEAMRRWPGENTSRHGFNCGVAWVRELTGKKE